MNIYQKLVEVRKAVPYLKKEAKGTQYNYTASSQVLASVREKMNEMGLLIIPKILAARVSEQTVEHKNKDGEVFKKTSTYFTELDLEMIWVNAENPEETISVPWYGQGVDIAGEKGVGKALTYAEKYLILKTFNIPTDQDDPDSFQMKHYDEPKEGQNNTPTPKVVSPKQADEAKGKMISEVATLCSELDLSPEWLEAKLQKDFGKKALAECTEVQLRRVINGLKKHKAQKAQKEG